jgi:hypothetical protein
MSNISSVVARVFVDDLEAAIPLYQQLAETTAVNRFGFRDVQLAQVGPFLRHLPPVIAAIQAEGGQIMEGPAPAPNDDRLIAGHPDGAVFGYIETGDQPP